MNLKGKIALVVGATGGIGSEIVKELDKEGANCILVARDGQKLSKLRSSLIGKDHQTLTADFSDNAGILKLTRDIKSKYSKIDLIFNYAGIGVYKEIDGLRLSEWELSLTLNTTLHFLLVKELLPLLKRTKKAVVVAPGTGCGKIPVSGRLAYNVSKFALRGLSLTLSKDFKKSDIVFVLITLGSVKTPFGPLGLKGKEKLEKEGKEYLDPSWVAEKIVRTVKKGELKPEVSIYPEHYFKEMKKGKKLK